MTILDAHSTEAVLDTPPGSRNSILAYLREMRHDRGISMAELAERVGTSQVSLAGALCGEHRLAPDVVAKLAAALDVDAQLVAAVVERQWLFSVVDEQPWNAHDELRQPNSGWPAVVCKEGSD